GGAPALAEDVGTSLPPGATVLQQSSGDTDGDGIQDTVALYTVRQGTSAIAEAGILVLRGPLDARSPFLLFGSSPKTPGPTIATSGSTPSVELSVRDVNADGLAEVVL